MYKKLLTIIFVGSIAISNAYSNSVVRTSPSSWLSQQKQFAVKKILSHMSPKDGLPGAIIAAPSRSQPNYYFHWVRDAGIVVDALIDVYTTTDSNDLKKIIYKEMQSYVNFCTQIQKTNSLTGLGEPKYYVNGQPFNGAWGRPQNDGPALRAISLIKWANVLLQHNQKQYVREKLYSGKLPATSPVKKDLEYISHHWKESSFDLWEEVKGSHFYTLMVTRKALLLGASLALQLQDNGAAKWYSSQAREIEHELDNFWDENNHYFMATINQTGGLDYKTSNLDVAVILGLLHGDMHDKFLSWDDKRVVATIEAVIQSFQFLYPINQYDSIPGVAIGRYPEDRYAGDNFDGGNPWPLCTLAIADALYRYAGALEEEHQKKAPQVLALADKFVARVHYHAHRNGDLDEQINKNSGYMTSAADLTWNYAALLATSHSAEIVSKHKG